MRKVILFDLDGVLVDACEWHYVSLNRALDKHCSFEISREDHESKFNGLSTRRKLEMLKITGDTADKVWQTKQDLTWDIIRELAKPSREKIDLHYRLILSGFRTACVTNAIRKTAELALDLTGQLEFMDFIVSNEDTENNKPHPDPYLLAFEKFGIKPEQALIVEDSDKGMQAAIKSGAHVLRVKNSTEVTLDNVFGKIKEIWTK